MERLLRIAALSACAFVLAHCGPKERTERYKTPGGGNEPSSGDATGNTGVSCAEGFATITGVLGVRNVGFTVPITSADYQAPVDSAPGWLNLTLDEGSIVLQFVNAPAQGGTVAARGVVFREKDDVTVGHCEDSVYSAQMALASDTAQKGSFYMTGLYGHDGNVCDKQPVAGTLAGCFYY